jgi:phage tail-like protein
MEDNFSLPLSHRFGVYFFAGGLVPNPLDIYFQKVSGLSMNMETESINEGGQNLYTHRIPKRASYGNLVLERGVALISPLNIEFNVAFSQFQFLPSNVLITLYNQHSIPLMGWMFTKAYPVKWSMSDLDAESNKLLIDSMELAYTRFQVIKL